MYNQESLNPTCHAQGLGGFRCLTAVGWIFTVIFTYSGFILLITAVFWSANIGKVLRRLVDRD
jgi:hypothetical protein